MSLLPVILNDVFRPISLLDQNYGLDLLNDHLVYSSLAPLVSALYLRPRHKTHQTSGASSVANDKDKFEVDVDIQQFKPEEINVKIIENYVTVEGKHEEKQDEHGFISRHFVRRYVLPTDVDADKTECKLSSDGVLTITVPKKALPLGSNERVIPITKSNAPAVKAAETTSVSYATAKEDPKKEEPKQ